MTRIHTAGSYNAGWRPCQPETRLRSGIPVIMARRSQRDQRGYEELESRNQSTRRVGPAVLGDRRRADLARCPSSGARTKIGETGGVPAGASCNVNPNGTVTIQDCAGAPALSARTRPRRLQTHRLRRPEPRSRCRAQPHMPPPAPRHGRAQINRPRPTSNARRIPSRSPARTGTCAKRERRASAPRPTSPPPATVENKLILLASRDETPTKSSPIHFRERMYAVPVPLQAGTGEKLATKLLRQVQQEIRQERGAKFIRIELFDHIWRRSPDHAPVVRIEWKDWNTSIEIDFPLEEETRHSEAPRISSVPPPPTEDRLALAFEACHDLLFLKNRAEALEFAVHLLEELVPSEATAAFLLDINTDEFRVVAARGTGARTRQGQAFPSSVRPPRSGEQPRRARSPGSRRCRRRPTLRRTHRRRSGPRRPWPSLPAAGPPRSHVRRPAARERRRLTDVQRGRLRSRRLRHPAAQRLRRSRRLDAEGRRRPEYPVGREGNAGLFARLG